MAYTLPNFNLSYNLLRGCDVTIALPGGGAVGPGGICNLAYTLKVAGLISLGMYLLVPKLTDIREVDLNAQLYDMVEVPAASGRWYQVYTVDDIGKGFANEHRCAVVIRTVNDGNTDVTWLWPVPYP